MDNKKLNKLIELEHWHEVLVLYSGLIDIDNKEDFIESLEDSKPLLAAQCINSNWATKIKAEISLVEKAKADLIYLNTKNSEIAITAVYTLLELGQIDSIIPLIQNCLPTQIHIFKPLIPKLIEQTGDNLESIVFALLETQPHIFLNQIFQILIHNPENKNLLRKIYQETHANQEVKKKHLFQFLKYFGINEKIYLPYDLQEQYVRVAKNYSDLVFIQRSQSFEIKFKDIIQIVFSQPLTSITGMMIFDIFINNGILRTTLLDHYLKELQQSNKYQNQAFYILLCKYFQKKCNISAGRLEKTLKNKSHLNKTIQNHSLFITLYTKLIDELKKIKSEKNAQNLVGRKEKVFVQSEYKYHYLTIVNTRNLPILIPKSEVDHPLIEGKSYNVRLTFFDAKSKQLFGSIKQLNKQKGQFLFNFENLKVVKEGDVLKAKIIKSNGRFNVKVYEIGKKTKVKILNPDFTYQEYENMYSVRIDQVNNFNEISVFVLKSIQQ